MRMLLTSILRALVQLVGRISLWATSRRAPRREVAGTIVIDVSGGTEAGRPALAKVIDAFEVIRTHDARRLQRFRHDVSQVLIWRQPTPAAFIKQGRRITLDEDFVLKYSAGIVASFLVHEAVHARLHRRGVDQSGSHFADVERRCYIEQLAFLERMPGTESWRQWAEAVLVERSFGGSKSAEHQRMRARRAEFVKSIGLPRWLERIAIRLVPGR